MHRPQHSEVVEVVQRAWRHPGDARADTTSHRSQATSQDHLSRRVIPSAGQIMKSLGAELLLRSLPVASLRSASFHPSTAPNSGWTSPCTNQVADPRRPLTPAPIEEGSEVVQRAGRSSGAAQADSTCRQTPATNLAPGPRRSPCPPHNDTPPPRG